MVKNIKKLLFTTFVLGTLASAEPGLASRDLWFLPLGGEFQSTTEGNYMNQREHLAGDSTHTQSFLLSQGLSYSLDDDWVVGALVGYKTKRESTDNSRTSTSGLTDPTFSILYRVTDQNYWPVFFDASFDVSPSFGRSQDNNVLRGSTKVDFNLALGQDSYDWSYKFKGTTSFFSSQFYGTGDSSGSIETRFDFGLNGALQYNFDPEWAAFVELGMLFPGLKNYNNTDYYEDAEYEFSAYVGPKYQFHRDLSAALKVYTKYEKGIIHIDSTEEYNYHTSSYGVNLALLYNF
jgi:hypothetical protein